MLVLHSGLQGYWKRVSPAQVDSILRCSRITHIGAGFLYAIVELVGTPVFASVNVIRVGHISAEESRSKLNTNRLASVDIKVSTAVVVSQIAVRSATIPSPLQSPVKEVK